jgi:TrmH family RNA methyltransferase
MTDWKENVYFILIEPKESGNIGASARAIKNMGFKNLCLVKPPQVITEEARWLACNALDVLESAETFDTLSDAVKDKSLVIGTTRRKGKRRGIIMPVDRGVKNINEMAVNNKVAVLFGRESRGLFNEEVEECGFLLSIPSSKDQPSLNLAQAVLIVSYELSKAEYTGQESSRDSANLVRHEDIAVLYSRIAETLKNLEYIPRGDRDLEKKIMQNLKHFIGRAGLTEWELNMLHGICSQIEKKISCKKN